MTQQPTILRNADALKEFNSANPIDFELLDDEGRQHIYILNDQSPGRTHHLVLANTSGQDLTFRKDPEIENNSKKRLPGPENHHFELRFRPGALDPAYLSWLSIGTGGWRLALKEHIEESDQVHDGTVSVYLLFVGDEELILRSNRTILLLLHHVKAGPLGGSRGSRVELRYRATDQQLLPDHTRTSPRSFRQERLQIINNQGKKELPMIAALKGSSTVLNDGKTASHLILQVSNLLQNATIPLNASDSESPSRFILTFDTSEEDAAWALTDADNAAAIDLRGEFKDRGQTLWNTRPELQGNNPQWIISLRDDLSMEVGDFFFLHIEGLKTSMPSGFTTLYLLYENIPGFWDGQFEIPIEKSPLRFDDIKETNGAFLQKTNVGIGNTLPQDTLDVNGGIRAETMVLRNSHSPKAPLSLDVVGKMQTDSLDVTGKTTGVGAHFSKPLNESFALETTGDAKIDGKITAKDIDITGSLSTKGTSSTSLELSESLTVGGVKVTGSDGILHVAGQLKDSEGFVIPKGGIIMWSGTNVPEGWKLCDGTDGTPDLRSRFIVGVGQGNGNDDRSERLTQYRLNEVGGRKSHVLLEDEMPNHNHNTFSGRDFHLLLSNTADENDTNIVPDGGFGMKRGNRTRPNLFFVGSISAKGSNLPHENRPPYFALAFIMKK